MASPDDCLAIAGAWLDTFSAGFASSDAEAIAQRFHSYGFLRDILTFTWTNRTLVGRPKIEPFLAQHLAHAEICDLELSKGPHLSPHFQPIAGAVVSGFTFETRVGPGLGCMLLTRPMGYPDGEWKALSVLMTLRDIRAHEEAGPEDGVYGGHTIPWEDHDRERREKIEADPYVLILGGGQTGLNVGARFKQMDISSIILERTAVVSNVPANWPYFTSRDKLAVWLEQYAVGQDLVVWTSSTLLPTPTFDESTKRWTATVSRAGNLVTLKPAHIVVAAGTLGSAYYPPMANPSVFGGTILHTANYHGAAAFSGKRVVVVGAGNSAADVCQDSVVAGAASVTMVQRSSTCVMSVETARAGQLNFWPEGVPTEVADLKVNALPTLLIEKPVHEGLREAGLKLNMGPDGAGAYLLMFERFGGFWLDVGCAQLIRDGKVKVKQGVEPASFTANSIVFTDGSSLEADIVVFATSYKSIRDDLRPLFGDAVIDQTAPLWGLDDEGELKGCYHPSGYPHLWFAAGNFTISRFFSKQLALTIKGIQLGLYEEFSA
ncbi:hypothetical protein MKEN_00994100 [Mycena kentingensis (nom. inval.)]|nr:hypothetical protein MKEN_00994100 [Mycena kentingensis (nom. inval.)]